MELAQTLTSAAVVGVVGTVLGFLVHGLRAEMRVFRAEVRDEIGSFRAEVRDEIGSFRAEVRQDIGELRRDMGDLRSDLTQVALAVGTKPTGRRTIR